MRFDVVPTHACDHAYEVSTYQPSERLRRLIQVRDHECTFPPCSRPARESDFEHAVPYDKGGRTDACNAGRPQPTMPSGQTDRPAGQSPSPSQAGTNGRPRPAAPTPRSHGGTPPNSLWLYMVRRGRAAVRRCPGRVLQSLPGGPPCPGFRSATGGGARPSPARGHIPGTPPGWLGWPVRRRRPRSGPGRWVRSAAQPAGQLCIEILDGGWGDWTSSMWITNCHPAVSGE